MSVKSKRLPIVSKRTQRRQANQSLTERVPWKKAIVFGVVTFAVVFVMVSGLVEVESTLGDETSGEDSSEANEGPGFLTTRSWVFFGSHFVDIEASATTGFGDTSQSFNVLDEWIEELPAVAFHLASIIGLVASGYIFGKRNSKGIQSETDAGIFGSAISAGYIIPVIFSMIIFDWQTEIEGVRVTYEIPFVEGILIAGLLFPVVFGAIGSYLAYSRD